MPEFQPFVGLRYGPDATDLSGVICPPYDVISPGERAALEASHEANCVRLELPVGPDPYQAAASLLASWRAPGGPLVVDDGPSFYVYRMGFTSGGRPRQTTGVLGALTLGAGVLPHEQTTPKDKADRMDLLQATRTNLSPIWGLTPASGLSAVCTQVCASAPPDAKATADGVHHRLWRVSSPGVVSAISSVVASEPVLIADGHHRYEVAVAYQSSMGQAGPHDAVMALVVELSEEELAVGAIHRLLHGLPTGWEAEVVLEPWFEMTPTGPVDETVEARMASAGALCLVAPDGCWLLRPRPAVAEAAAMDLDSSRLDVVLDGLPDVAVRYQHGWSAVADAVAAGTADAGVLLRPASVAQIAAVAHGGQRMPPKTTFFMPKPATGMVFRCLDDQ